MQLSVILTCHNRKSKTLACLGKLHSQNCVNHIHIETFLVDDGSTDGTGEAVKGEFPEIHVIEGDGNLYWNRGMLLAWEHALNESTCDAVLWLNDDTMLLPHALDSLLECAARHPDSIVVGSTRSEDGEMSYGGYQNRGIMLKPKDKELPCKIFNGNIVLVPRSVSDKIGLLDRRFSHAMGDFEYGRRAHKQGVESFVIPPIGICDRNGNYVRWKDKKYSLVKRLQLLYSPLGNNPFEAFYYIKEDSILRASVVFVYLHLAALFPNLFRSNHSL